jgi:hypothetical protein
MKGPIRKKKKRTNKKEEKKDPSERRKKGPIRKKKKGPIRKKKKREKDQYLRLQEYSHFPIFPLFNLREKCT